MSHQNFEKYAIERPMTGPIAYDYVSFFKKHIDYKNSDLKILDFGCGDGRYFLFFKQFFRENNIYGVEVSEIRIKRAKKLGWKNVFKIKDFQPLPFKDSYFDFINFDQVIEHIPSNKIEFYLKELKRILKPNGKIIIVTPNYPIKRVYDLLNALVKRDPKRIFDDPTHVAQYNFKMLNSLLKKYFREAKLEPTEGLFYKWFRKNFFSHKIIGLCIK